MIYPTLAPIDWQALLGGDKDATAAIAARDRKLAKSAELLTTVLPLSERLRDSGALYESSPAILAAEPLAARWYLDLAGLTRKLLNKLAPSYSAAGVLRHPDSIATSASLGKSIDTSIYAAFAHWINDVLEELYPPEKRSYELALLTVLTLNGARIDGSVRNKTGDDAVLILKTILVGGFSTRGLSVEVETVSGQWIPYGPHVTLNEHRRIRFGSRLVCEFVPGGNRPDIKVLLDGIVVAFGEVKGRTDLSNVWESWMPQVQGHLQTWSSEASMAPRLFFGTVITQEMIDGKTVGGTQHNGLRALRNHGLLSGAYNLTNIAAAEPGAVAMFDDLVDQLVSPLAAS